MTTSRFGQNVIEFPQPLEVAISRDFEAPIQLVFDVFFTPEHMRHTIAPFGEEVTECTVDQRVGGEYRYTFLTLEGMPMTFFGEFLEVDPPHRSVQTWQYDGWPDVVATETVELRETEGGTSMTWTLAFRDQAGRDHMSKFDGVQANFDNVDAYLRSLQQA